MSVLRAYLTGRTSRRAEMGLSEEQVIRHLVRLHGVAIQEGWTPKQFRWVQYTLADKQHLAQFRAFREFLRVAAAARTVA